jgi:hypothetical protein
VFQCRVVCSAFCDRPSQLTTEFGRNNKTASAAGVAPAIHAEKRPERQHFNFASYIHADGAIATDDLDRHWFSQYGWSRRVYWDGLWGFHNLLHYQRRGLAYILASIRACSFFFSVQIKVPSKQGIRATSDTRPVQSSCSVSDKLKNAL